MKERLKTHKKHTNNVEKLRQKQRNSVIFDVKSGIFSKFLFFQHNKIPRTFVRGIFDGYLSAPRRNASVFT